LERHASLLERLPVVANGSAFVRGDWLVVPGQATDGHPGVFAPMEVSVRYTQPVRTALTAAGKPVRFGVLAELLAATYPTAAVEQIHSMLSGLVAQHVLLTGRFLLNRPHHPFTVTWR